MELMDEWIDGMDDKWTDKETDGLMDGWIEVCMNVMYGCMKE